MAKVRNSGSEAEETEKEPEKEAHKPGEEPEKEADEDESTEVEDREQGSASNQTPIEAAESTNLCAPTLDREAPAEDEAPTNLSAPTTEAEEPEKVPERVPEKLPEKEEDEDVEMEYDSTGTSSDGDGDGKEEEEQPQEDADDNQPMQLEKFYFGPTEYSKACMIRTRCDVSHVLHLIGKLPEELKLFRAHPQFKHIFHMFKEPNHMSQGLWMLLLHTVSTEKKNEAWFVVNGVPIRYSLKEHALLSGLDCHEYPNDYEKLGSLKFVKKHFGRDDKIKIAEVEAELNSMKESSVKRKKIVVLFFLSKVLKAESKADGNIDPFLLRVAGDLKMCKTFPWGRYTFDETMKEIRCVLDKFDGCVKRLKAHVPLKSLKCMFCHFHTL